MYSPSNGAVRQVPHAGTETAAFIGTKGSKVFAVAHLPATAPCAVTVMCPGLYAEQLTNYRAEVLLARALSKAGVATVRFQYRGTGNSDDAPEDHPTFATMLEDAKQAEAWAVELSASQVTDFIGLRLGALVAASCVAEHPGVGLCAIEPVLDGKSWFRGLSRARRTAALRLGKPPGPDEQQDLEQLGEFDAFGFQVSWLTISSVRDLNLETELGQLPRPVMLVQMAVNSELRADYAACAERLRSLGSRVDTTNVRQGRSWWFVPEAWEIEETRPENIALMETVCGWLGGGRLAA